MRRVLLAKITSAHGVKGLVKVLFYGEDASLLDIGSFYTDETEDNTIHIKIKNTSGKYFLAHVDGVQDRDAAELLKNTHLYINRSDLPDINEDDTFYYEDLVDLKVEDKSGKDIGRVLAVHNFGAGDLLEIKPSSGDAFFLPFTYECVPSVSSDKIVVIVPDGLT